jgi:hypothetical protein
VAVPAGCQAGGLIGRTYNVQGGVSGITLTGSMKGAANLITKLDKDNNNTYIDYLASGGIVGFNSVYADDEKVMNGTKGYSNLHFDTILISMEMTDVDSYFGGTRDVAIDLSGSRISLRDIVYDKAKYEASGLPMWGARIDQNRRIDDSKETNSQLEAVVAYDTVEFYTNEIFDDKVNEKGAAINHYTWMPKLSTWTVANGGMMVSTNALREVIENALQCQNLFVIGYQTKANQNDSAKTDFRFVSVMYRIEKPYAGYLVTISYVNENGKQITSQKTVYCDTLYTALNGGEEKYTADRYNGRYFLTFELQGISLDLQEDVTVTLCPFSSEQNGAGTLLNEYSVKTYVLN